MNQDTINRYQPGGDFYDSAVAKFGQSGANALAAAAATGDQAVLNDTFARLNGDGYARNTSTLSILGNQLATDPLAAPLESANRVLGNTFFSFLKNPWVLVTVAVVLFFLFGGADLIKRKVAKL